MSKKSLSKNYFYNLAYQLVLVLSPLITTPYVSRTLGAVQTGKYSFTFSIVSIFVLFCSLGFDLYGQRLIASQQSEVAKQRITFFEILICKLVVFVFVTSIYFVPILFRLYQDKYILLFVVEALELINILFDISYFFRGNEDFGKIAIRSVLARVLGVILIFIFVKEQDDLILYAIIQSGTVLIGSISLWLYLPKRLVKSDLRIGNPFRHLPHALCLFLPAIAVSVYTLLDKTLIGVITSSDFQVGNYEYAEKMVRVLLTIVASLGTVLISRNSALFEQNKTEELKKNVYLSFDMVVHFAFPALFGIFIVARRFSLCFLGEEYTLSGNLMRLLCPIILLIGVSNIFGQQYLIPTKQDKKYTIAILIGSLTNIIINIPLILLFNNFSMNGSKLGAFGAAISTSIAELVVCALMFVFIRKEIGYSFLKKMIKPIIACLIMFVVGIILTHFLPIKLWCLFVIVGVCAVLYFLTLIILKDSFLKEFYDIIKKKFRKKEMV